MSLTADKPDKPRWGDPPWTVDFRPTPQPVPAKADFAVIGGGFTGLSAAAWLRRLEPAKSVVLLEAGTIGAGSSGRTGGMALAESAVGNLPGLGDVLGGFGGILRELQIDCDLHLPGVWELGRKRSMALPEASIAWDDSGTLRAVREVTGGRIDAGKLVSGLARAAERAGAQIAQEARVENVTFSNPLRLDVAGQRLEVDKLLLASNAQSLELSSLAGHSEPMFTLAVATGSLSDSNLESLGLASGKSFYTVDFPYLWGRLLPGGRIIFGGGLVRPRDWRELSAIDVAAGEAAERMASLEHRVHHLHPALRDVAITHRWGGPMLAGEEWRPAFRRHPQNPNVLVLGAYSGHGVALSVYLGRWAAEVMLGRRQPPAWDDA